MRIYEKVELIEISCVPVGSNREALSRSKQRKADFVAAKKAKKAEQEEEKILNEIRQNNPNFDRECEEFAELLLGYDSLNEDSEVPDEYRGMVTGKKNSFATSVTGNNKRL